jgi:hypothetical protein
MFRKEIAMRSMISKPINPHIAMQPRMLAMQLGTHEGAFICNVKETDLAKIDAREVGTLVIIHYAIRLDAMIEGQYELHETKAIDTSTIVFYQLLQRKLPYIVGKRQPTLYLKKERHNG